MFSASRIARWRGPLLAFLMGQPVVQFLNLFTGFCLVRWLDIQEYAMFGITFAFQSTVTQLTDLGFSGSVVALAGSRSHDPEVLGGYLYSARYWRSRLQGGILLLAAVAFPLIVWKQPWDTSVKLLLFISISMGVLFQNWNMYGAALLVHRALWKYYTPQIFGAVLRLAFCAGLYISGLLSACAAAISAALLLGYTGISYRRSSRTYVQEPLNCEPSRNAEMLRYLAPIIPAAAFTALQSQVLVGIIAVFGSTQNIAEVSALGRIGQLFVLLAAFNAVFIEPYIARVSLAILGRRYFQILGAAVGISAIITTVGFVIPQPLLWLLGQKYAGLHEEIGWVILNSSLCYLGGVMWTIHAARRWVFWWSTIVYIGSTVLVQAVCLLTMDLSHTLAVIKFGLFSTCVGLGLQTAIGIYGFKSGKSCE
ncbi:lipopolysaccharide biosynthesis protein [Prosthecobacter fluviatilis]|uniref:Lipopolysaccharide biosynthesis protein n=1 Tax=Prosthecobacter fluviatilis TaxID=445931 RepID=A0ABW0KQS6_9BACT